MQDTELKKTNKFCDKPNGPFLIPGTHRISATSRDNGIYRYKVYDPGRCEINIETYLTDYTQDYGDCLTKSRFLDVIKANGLSKIKRVVNIVSVETHEDYRGQGIATSLLLDFLRGYKTSKTDIVVTHSIQSNHNNENSDDFWRRMNEINVDFECFFKPFGFHLIPDLSETSTITFTNSYLYVSPESEAAKSLYRLFERKIWGVENE